jgi:hypothetical protein
LPPLLLLLLAAVRGMQQQQQLAQMGMITKRTATGTWRQQGQDHQAEGQWLLLLLLLCQTEQAGLRLQRGCRRRSSQLGACRTDAMLCAQLTMACMVLMLPM